MDQDFSHLLAQIFPKLNLNHFISDFYQAVAQIEFLETPGTGLSLHSVLALLKGGQSCSGGTFDGISGVIKVVDLSVASCREIFCLLESVFMIWMFGGEKKSGLCLPLPQDSEDRKKSVRKMDSFSVCSVGKVLEGAVWGWGEQGAFNLFPCLARPCVVV